MSLRPAWSTYELQTNQGCAARSQKEKNERSHLVMQCCNPSAGEAETAEFPEWWPASLLKLSSEFSERLSSNGKAENNRGRQDVNHWPPNAHATPPAYVYEHVYTYTTINK